MKRTILAVLVLCALPLSAFAETTRVVEPTPVLINPTGGCSPQHNRGDLMVLSKAFNAMHLIDKAQVTILSQDFISNKDKQRLTELANAQLELIEIVNTTRGRLIRCKF